jgi:hypothetical protein
VIMLVKPYIAALKKEAEEAKAKAAAKKSRS